VDASGQNRIIVVSGANDALLPQDLDLAAPILRKADYIVLQLEIPLNTVYHAIHFAKSNGIRCILNPAPGRVLDLTELPPWTIHPDESEAELITGMPVHSIEDARSCADSLLGRGIRRVVITLGERGALLSGPEGMELIPGFRVKTIDSTGAGDPSLAASLSFLPRPPGGGGPYPGKPLRCPLHDASGNTKILLEQSEFEQEWEGSRGRS